uniref:uncharacterized protein LOC122585740 isoform X2 n=1 Tax=Erigeron canadensis TaxID=72917 RepID=UPI001CB89806|nr:uncharacterized protein LOC122585740 isoform X2 [Erigeron canadensis]
MMSLEEIINTNMDTGSTIKYVDLIIKVVPNDISVALMTYTGTIFRAELENNYTKPISWIGMYIAAASLLCVFAMAADLWHGLRNSKRWFPCKYFTVNAAFLSVISAAMKLPMDISSSMPGNVDQLTKLGSMAFLCTMMANFLPSLATMNSKELLTNITGLGVMVITLVVNVGIQIKTGVVSCKVYDQLYNRVLQRYYSKKPVATLPDIHRNIMIAAVYCTLLLLLLIIHVCSSLAILKSKDMINEKYQKHFEEDFSNDTPLDTKMVQKHVTKYWIMAGSPQFVTVSFVTTSACGVICVLSTALHIRTLFWSIGSVKDRDYNSDYQGSMLVILIIQSIGVILGTIVPFCRSFAVLCFKVSFKSIKNHIIKVFKVESYWTDKLFDDEWKVGSETLPFRDYRGKVIIERVKFYFLIFCRAFQVGVVVTCKIISLVPVFMICAFYCLKCLKDKGKADKDLEDLRLYVFHLQDDTEVSVTTLNRLSKSTMHLIKKGERQQPKGLLELIKKSFEGVENFDRNQVKSLRSKVEGKDSWSLLVVTLTVIAASLPDIDTIIVDKLLESVREGLEYVAHVEESLNTTDDKVSNQTHVEESLNTTRDKVSNQKAARTLWNEFKNKKTWFGKNMQQIASEKKTREIVQLFKDRGENNRVKEVKLDDKSICADSMYLVTNEILLSHAIDQSNPQKLFEHISQMISGILADCLTNLPKVIAMKCHNREIEKREASVQAAARLLGETTQIIKILQDPQQCVDPNEPRGVVCLCLP